MNDSAQVEILRHTDKNEDELLNEVGGELNVNPKTLNPDDHTPLDKVKEEVEEKFGDVAHVIGSAAEEVTTGISGTTHTRDMKSKIPLSIAAIRQKLKFKKAA